MSQVTLLPKYINFSYHCLERRTSVYQDSKQNGQIQLIQVDY